MKPELPPKTSDTALEHILSSAVVLNWAAVACQYQGASVRIDYHIGTDGAVDYLKLWACGREYWSLICDYAPLAGWSDGPRFANGYHSRSLGRLLQTIMMNQNLFRHDHRPNTSATVEIGIPTPEETECAAQRVSQAFERPA